MSEKVHLDVFIEIVKGDMKGRKFIIDDFIDSALDMQEKYKYVNEINKEAMSNKEWTPEEGDLIEVSDDGKNWEDDKRIFLAVVPRVELPVIVVSLGEEERYNANASDIEWGLTSNSFRYMRPIKEDLTEAEANEEIRKILSRIKK